MKENFKYEGEWFLPSDETNRVSGILTYDRNRGCLLKLLGGFSELEPFTYSDSKEIFILGLTSNSKKITLYDCFVSDADNLHLISGQEIGKPSVTYTLNYVFVDIHIRNEEEMKFKKIIAEINQLDEWLSISGFSLPKVDRNNSEYKYDLHYELPKPINFSINNEIDGKFNFTAKHSDCSTVFNKEMSIVQTVKLEISSKSDISLNDYLLYLHTFQGFLMFAIQEKTYPLAIQLFNENNEKVQLYFSHRGIEDIQKNTSLIRYLFRYSDIRDNFQEIMKNWYELYDKVEPAFNILFDSFYNNKQFTVNSFLNLAQAIETFHTKTDNHTKMPKECFDIMKTEILYSAPKKYHDWLNGQFHFGNGLSLHERLTDMMNRYSNSVIDQFIEDKETFVKDVKWSRNYYTHYSSGEEKRALKGEDLFNLTKKLKLLLACAFLVKSGFDKQTLENCLKNFYPVSSLKFLKY